MIHFTADTHFGHQRQAVRRFLGSVEEHDATLVTAWNLVVRASDTVWHLGDFSFAGRVRTEAIVKQLNGQIHLVPGNHDSPSLLRQLAGLGVIVHEPIVRVRVWTDVPRVTLCHYPLLTWPSSHKGAFHLHGHSHGNLRAAQTTRIDVGVDGWPLVGGTLIPFKPFSQLDLAEILRTRSYVPVDHHDRAIAESS